jgi:acetyl-CoA carboxylase biotin carboxyl carrier protein
MTDKLSVDENLIRRLADLLEETGLSEIEIGEGEQHLRVVRAGSGPALAALVAPAAAGVPVPGPSGDAAVNGAEADGHVDAGHPGAIIAPMVGTIYLAPDPGSPPYITQGGSVQEGDTLFIIEAMKTMNPVRAPRGGTVRRVLVQNETPVEYGEVLAVIE